MDTMPTHSEITLWITSTVALCLQPVKPGHRKTQKGTRMDSEEVVGGASTQWSS
jgi:hypothetical protein